MFFFSFDLKISFCERNICKKKQFSLTKTFFVYQSYGTIELSKVEDVVELIYVLKIFFKVEMTVK